MRKSLVFGLCFSLVFSMIIPVTLGLDVKTIPNLNEFKSNTTSYDDIDWWPMFHHDLNRTGYSTSKVFDFLSLEWTFSLNTMGIVSPTVSFDKVYVGSHDHHVYCLKASNSEMLWSYEAGHNILTSPSEFNDKIYFGDAEGVMTCLNGYDGDFIWEYKTGAGIFSSSPVVYDGKVFFGSEDYNIYCLNETSGELLWKYKTDDVIRASPTIYNDKVYVGSYDKIVYCLNASDGEPVWKYDTGSSLIHGSLAIYDGKVYVGNTGHKMLCLNATNGNLIWMRDIGREILASPAVAYGNVYVICHNNWRLFCLNASNGETIWSFKAEDKIASCPIVADGKVYFNTYGYLLYCLNSSNGELFWTYDVGGIDLLGSPAIADRVIYVSAVDHPNNVAHLHAFKTQEYNNPPESPNIVGLHIGKPDIEYDFSFQASDKDSNPINYYIDWGDGYNSGWLGEYQSGTEITLSHSWVLERDFIIKAKAKDYYGNESDWSEFEIKISNPRSKITLDSVWQGFLDLFPILERIFELLR